MKRLIKLLTTAVFTLLVVFSAVTPVQASNQQFLNAKEVVKATKTVKAGWKKSNGKWWYQNANGTYPKNKWQKISGKWYHFDAKGYMQTGWLKLSNKWYYLGTNGVMVSNKWVKISGKEYYFYGNGQMAVSTFIGSYYVGSNGAYIKSTTPATHTTTANKTVGTKVGTITIQGKGYSANLYNGTQSQYQKIVDATNSALYTKFMGKKMLADHAAQGLNVIKNTNNNGKVTNAEIKNRSVKATITENGVKKTYVMVSRYDNATNVGNGIKVGNKYADQMNDGELFMYCCNDAAGVSVTVTFWQEVK